MSEPEVVAESQDCCERWTKYMPRVNGWADLARAHFGPQIPPDMVFDHCPWCGVKLAKP